MTELTTLTQAVVKVGNGGRGFVVKTQRLDDFVNHIVITAAHCLAAGRRKLPPAHPGSYLEERTYANLLGPLGKAKPKVWAECLFADPLADIAVLGSPDGQELYEQAEAYEALMERVPCFSVADAPKDRVKQIKLAGGGRFSGSFKKLTPGSGTALVLTLEGEWGPSRCEAGGAGPDHRYFA
jgi:hypothetical protein